jgi:hypothetical protein
MTYRYKEIESCILERYFKYIISSDAILKDIGSHRELHTGGFWYEKEGKELLTPLQQISSTIEISLEAIAKYDLEILVKNVHEFTQERINMMHRIMYNTVEQVTTLVGNTVNGGGKPFNPDLLLDMLEKVYVPFDEKGEPIVPTIVMHPDVYKKSKDIQFTKEQEKRQKQILEKKKKEYYAKKRYRNLSYIY